MLLLMSFWGPFWGPQSKVKGFVRVWRFEYCSGSSQRLQNPLIVKEYTLNHIREPTIIQGIGILESLG